MKKLIFVLLLGIFLVSFVGAECYGGVDLDINKIERTPGQSTFKIIATANGNGDCLNIAWSKNDLNNLLNKESPEELTDKDITGDIQLIEQKDIFHTSLDSFERLYSYSIGDSGWHPFSCNANTCSENGYSNSEFYVKNILGNCYCVYKDSQIATFGTFSGIGDRNGKAVISFSGLSPLNIEYGQNDGTKSNDKLTASWRGDLLAGHSINAPNYNVYEDSGGNFHIISPSFYEVKDATFDANGKYSITIRECLGESDGWEISGINEAQNCINEYNTIIDQLLEDKISDYLSSTGDIVKSASFEGSNFVVEETPYSSSYPQFTLTFDAEWAGVHWVTGQPEVTCPHDDSFSSGESKVLNFNVKNIADEKGAFSLNLDCEGISSTLAKNKISLGSENSEEITVMLTASTEDLKEVKCNFKAYATREPSKSDECSFNLEVKPLIGFSLEEINNSQGGITGAATARATGKSSTGTIILIIFLVLIGGSIAYYVYSQKSKKELGRKVKQEVELRKGKFCNKCGGKLKPQSKFCSKCGKTI